MLAPFKPKQICLVFLLTHPLFRSPFSAELLPISVIAVPFFTVLLS